VAQALAFTVASDAIAVPDVQRNIHPAIDAEMASHTKSARTSRNTFKHPVKQAEQVLEAYQAE